MAASDTCLASSDFSDLVRETHDAIAEMYDARLYDSVDDDREALDRFLFRLPAGARILDLGCGPGNFTQAVFEAGFQAVGIDISEEMLKIARRKSPILSFVQADLRCLPFTNNAFDGMLAAYSLIHVPMGEMDVAWKEIVRVLKPGGFFLFLGFGALEESEAIIPEPLDPSFQTFVHRFERTLLERCMTQAGLCVRHASEYPYDREPLFGDRVISLLAQKE